MQRYRSDFWRRDLNCSYIQTVEQEPESQKRPDSRIHNLISFTRTEQFRGLSLAEGIIATMFVLVPLSVHAGVVSKMAGLLDSDEVVYEKQISNQSAGDVKLLAARTSPDLKSHQGGGDVIVDEGALLSSGPFDQDDTEHVGSGEISIHTVRPCTEDSCETLSHIAEMYGVSVNTILWANDINDPSLIHPGDDLIILPITGIRHVVKSGDTLASIAKKYGASTDEQVNAMVADIMSYNRLASISDIKTGDTIVVPGGTMHTATVAKTTPSKSTGSSTGSTRASASGFVNPLPGAVKTQGIHGYNAVDLAAPIGTPIHAAAAGEVIVAKVGGWNGGYGSYVVIKHSNGTQTLYAHASQVNVSIGEKVTAGETIANVGSTGQSTGPHLHFEVRGATNPF